MGEHRNFSFLDLSRGIVGGRQKSEETPYGRVGHCKSLLVELEHRAAEDVDPRNVQRDADGMLQKATALSGEDIIRLQYLQALAAGKQGEWKRAMRLLQPVVDCVEDEGPGISPDKRASLFHRFYLAGSVSTGGGKSTGLGLYLVRRHADLPGARVGFRPREPQGSIFFCRFISRAKGVIYGGEWMTKCCMKNLDAGRTVRVDRSGGGVRPHVSPVG